MCILPETNIAPEKWLEDYFPFWEGLIFMGLC